MNFKPYFLPNILTGLAITASVMLGVFFAPSAHAESQITLSPTSQRLEITPGKTQESSFTIINSGNKAIDVKIYAAPYQVLNENYDPVFSKDTPRTQISRWISFNKTSYSLQPNEQVQIPYVVNVPQSVPDGGQYAAIFAETSEKQDKSSILRKKRVGVIVYGRVKGKTNESGEVELAKIGGLQITKKLDFNQKLINKGNTDAVADIQVSATTLGGKEIFSSKQQKPTIPDTSRIVSFSWDKTPSIGIVNLSQNVNFAGKQTSSKQTILILSPTAFAIGCVAILITIGGIIYAVRQSKKRPTMRHRR